MTDIARMDSRLPPAFGDVPTDADYAMQLISERVAAGLDVKPTKSTKSKRKHTRNQTMDDDDTTGKGSDVPDEAKSQSIDWKKWGERAAIGKTWAEDSKRLIGGRQVWDYYYHRSDF